MISNKIFNIAKSNIWSPNVSFCRRLKQTVIVVVGLTCFSALALTNPFNQVNQAPHQLSQPEKISTIDYVQFTNGLKAEALFYYQNNWLALRKMAKAKGYIDSFTMLETKRSKALPYDLMLITTYADIAQYDQREKNFRAVMQSRDGLKLLNEKKPNEFRINWQAQEQLQTHN